MTMVDKAPKPFWSGKVKFAGLAIAGGIAGFAMAMSVGSWFKDGGALSHIAGAEPALLTAGLYALMGVFVLLGSLSPQVGAAVLNVEDADEVREQGPVFIPSAISCVLLGVSLAALALGGEGGLLSPIVAGAVAFAAIAIACAASFASMHQSDELMREVVRQSASASFYLVWTIFLLWAAASQLGDVRTPRALDLLAILYAAPLAASFWVIGRRGMLMPRG
jgi:hypothetical protein